MSRSNFSTHALPVGQQFPAWCGWFEPFFEVVPPAAGPGTGFAGEVCAWSIGHAALSRVQAPQLHAKREARNLRRDGVDHWNLILGGAETRLVCAGRPIIIPGGAPFVVSLAEALESNREADTRFQLFLPRDQFASLAPVLDRLRGMPLGGAGARLLADYLRLLAHSIEDLPEENLARLSHPIEAMIAACLAPSAATVAQGSAQINFIRLDQVRRAIQRRLHSATLNAASLCRDVGMSRSQLYRLMEGEGGVAHYIQRLRLQASHAALSDAQEQRSIAAIAEAFGFYDASTFSRAFRREFGITPSELRVEARSGIVPVLLRPALLEAETRTLTSYLRSA